MENKPPLKIAVLTESINKLEEAYPNGEVQDSNEFGKLFMGGISTPIYPISRLRKIDTAYILESEHEKILNELKLKMEGIRLSAIDKYQNNKHRPLSEACIEAESCIDVINELIREFNLLITK